MLESTFKTKLVGEIKERLPGAIVAHLDPNEIQGIPDLVIFYKKRWATLEGKKDPKSKKQPNQDYYVGLMNEMSFSRFIDRTNKDEVLNELEQALRPRTNTRRKSQ